MRRVVVTGIGLITPIGIGKEEFWKNNKEGKSGIYVLEKDNQGTKFTYIEEFDVCDNYQNEVEKIYSDISKKVNPILQKITDYFNSEHILQ